MNRLFRWVPDLFGRHKIVEKHEEILHDIVITTSEARQVTRKVERSFPISRTIGNPRIRRDVHYVR